VGHNVYQIGCAEGLVLGVDWAKLPLELGAKNNLGCFVMYESLEISFVKGMDITAPKIVHVDFYAPSKILARQM